MNESLNPVISSKKSSKRCESRKSPAIERYENTAPALMRLSGNKAEWIMKVRAKESSSFPLNLHRPLFLPAKNAMKGRSKDDIMLKCIPESAKT